MNKESIFCEKLPGNNCVIDGDVLPGCYLDDLDSELLIEDPTYESFKGRLEVIQLWEESQELLNLAQHGYRNKDVRRQGGVRLIQETARLAQKDARKLYLDTLGLPSDQSGDIDKYYEGVAEWLFYREKILKNPEAREDQKTMLNEEIAKHLKTFYSKPD